MYFDLETVAILSIVSCAVGALLALVVLTLFSSNSDEDRMGRRIDHAKRLKVNEIFRQYRAGALNILETGQRLHRLGVKMLGFRGGDHPHETYDRLKPNHVPNHVKGTSA